MKQYYAAKFSPNLSTRNLWANLQKAGVYGKDNSVCDIDPELFSSHFLSLQTSSTSNVLQTSSTSSVSSSPRRISPSDNDDGFSFRCVDASEVMNAIFAIKSNATGPDGISPRFVKILLPWIIEPLLRIFNTCLTTSQFPSIWKTATVLPVPKILKAKELADYRPISILCFLAKVFEKLLSLQITEYLNGHNLLSPYQSGFRRSHSCETALIEVTSNIRKSLDMNHLCVLTLLDFSKAFDLVNHSKLLSKLGLNFHFSRLSVALIGSFLSGRSQRVYLVLAY